MEWQRRVREWRWARCGLSGLAAAAMLCGQLACAAEQEDLLLASTTSTEDSGLFEALLPAFMAAHPGVRVRVTAVGSGQALELGRRRDADVLLVHAPAAESAFLAQGHGEARCAVMYNDYLIVGPAGDPAAVAGLADVAAALDRIAAAGAEFISRGDDSGTHRKERSLWAEAGRAPSPGTAAWYTEVGQGMAEVLQMAFERRAYTLTDRATYLSQRPRVDLVPLVSGDARLFNPYSVIPVAGARHSGAARAFARWITGPEAQALIRDFGRDRVGSPLFTPDAGDCPL